MSAVQVEKLFDNPAKAHYDGDARGTIGHPIGRKIRVVPLSKNSEQSRLLSIKDASWNSDSFEEYLIENGVSNLEKIYEHKFFDKTEDEISSLLTGTSEKQKREIAKLLVKTLNQYKSFVAVSLEQQFCDLMFLETANQVKFDIFQKSDDEEIAVAIAQFMSPRISRRSNIIIFSSVIDRVIKKIKEEKINSREDEIEFDF